MSKRGKGYKTSKSYKKWYRKHFTPDGKRIDERKPSISNFFCMPKEIVDQGKLIVAETELTHPVHGWFLYQCRGCGAIYKMWLDKGLEDRLQDSYYPDKHKPVPFAIGCRKCKKNYADHILWGIGDSEEYTELPDGANYFKNTDKDDCGKPIISEPDAVDLEHFKRALFRGEA